MSYDPIKVLLIEDNPGDTRLICEMLAEARDAQIEVECADRLSAGLKRLAAEGIDVLLLDLSLPDGQGLDVCVRTHTQAPYVPIVVLTGLDDETMAAKTLQIGAQDYLVKGQVDSKLLLRSIRYAIERKRAEETLKESEEKYRNLIENAPIGIVISTPEGRILEMNKARLAMTGYDSKEEYIGKPTSERYYDSKDRDHWIALLREKGKVEGFEMRFKHKDGTSYWVSMASIPQITESGEQQFILVVQDITERKQAQEQLQHSQLLASLGEMTAGIAHEVNNPLSSVLLYSELLMGSDVPSQIKKDLKVIHDEAKRAAMIMTDLLTYSRRVESQMRRLNLHGILKKVLDMRRYEEKVQNITVSANLLDGPLYVKGDSAHLMQVFMNLILNAEEALREGNGGNIIITTQIDREWGKVSVADDGTGIPEENLERVFYPFFTTKQVGEGTGLGLSVCYGIVTAHGGLIHAENNKMGGATFTVELPLAETRRQGSSPRRMSE